MKGPVANTSGDSTALLVSLLAVVLAVTGCEAPTTLPAGSGQQGGKRAAGEGAAVAGVPAARRVDVRTEAVVLERSRTHIEAIGTARARSSTVLYPVASGEVRKVHFKAGQFVRKGGPVVELDQRKEELAVNLANVALSEAEQLLARYRRIEDTGAVSDSQIDEARTRVEAARLQLEQARVALAERVVRAPFDGHLSLSDVDVGARVSTTTELARIDDRAVLYVDFPVPEQVFGDIAPGMSVAVEAFTSTAPRLQAEVVAIDSGIDPQARTFIVRAALDNAQDLLRPGMSFRIVFDIEGPEWPVVPEAAIVWGGDGPSLWLVREGEAVAVNVGIRERRAGRVLIEASIAAGERVIAEGVQKVRPGTAVNDLSLQPRPIAAEADIPESARP
jgi:membrane fusion protein, multidrug efflux system